MFLEKTSPRKNQTKEREREIKKTIVTLNACKTVLIEVNV